MIAKKKIFILVLSLLVMTAAMAFAATDSSSGLAGERASWLLQRGAMDDYVLTGLRYQQSEFGSGEGPDLADDFSTSEGGAGSPGWSVLASLVLPGSGEALLGYKRGYAMMALDIFAWTRVVKYHGDGGDLRDEYYIFADENYSDENLVLAYQAGAFDPRAGLGDMYFEDALNGTINDVEDLHNLSLYVTVEADRREYYENLGKWDQFIFGWDDFQRPADPTGDINELRQPGISDLRDEYRLMRDESNDAFKSRDRWLYANIGLRVFSVLQVAYLSGMLGGGDSYDLEVAGHPVQFVVQPYGLTAGTVAAAVDF